MNCKPYIDILKELDYILVEKKEYDCGIVIEDLDPDDDDITIFYYLKFQKEEAIVELQLYADGYKKVHNYFVDRDYNKLDINKLELYISSKDNDFSILYFRSCTLDSELTDISRVTTDLFEELLYAKRNYENELDYDIQILKKYTEYYEKIIKPIIIPVIKKKNINYCVTFNNNIVYRFYNNDNSKILFTIGMDYLTKKLYFYVSDNAILFDFGDIISTKGQFIELLSNYLDK